MQIETQSLNFKPLFAYRKAAWNASGTRRLAAAPTLLGGGAERCILRRTVGRILESDIFVKSKDDVGYKYPTYTLANIQAAFRYATKFK